MEKILSTKVMKREETCKFEIPRVVSCQFELGEPIVIPINVSDADTLPRVELKTI